MDQNILNTQNLSDTNRIKFRRNGQLFLLFVENILHCQAEGSYTRFYLLDGTTDALICQPLIYIENQLLNKGFIRCHRTYLVNLMKVESFCNRDRTLSISDYKIPVSKRKSKEIFQILLQMGIKDKKNTNRL